MAAVGSALCIDLCGYDYEVNDTAFHPYQYSVLTVRDSVGGGNVISHKVNATYGAAVIVSGNSNFNWYADGTLSCVAEPTEESPAARTILCYGTVNLYNGTILGGKVISGTSNKNYEDGCGAAVYLPNSGKLNVCGGKVVAGDAAVKGDCVYMPLETSQFSISGNGRVDEVYINKRNTDTNAEQLTVNGGIANLAYDVDVSLKTDDCIGTGSDVSGLNIIQPEGYAVNLKRGKMYLKRAEKVARIGDVCYTDLNMAFLAYTDGVIELLKDVKSNISVYSNAVMDLNGHSITGNVTVSDGKVLWCIDTVTDDYNIDDGNGYGKLTSVKGDVRAASSAVLGEDRDYMLITESAGLSFHRINLTLTYVTLLPDTVGIKYKSEFEGDRLVAENVKQFGIAFHLAEAPNENNLTPENHSRFTDFQPGAKMNGTTAGTSVVNIMTTNRDEYHNDRKAQCSIYGSAYILTNDGEYLFGQVVSRSFREVVIETDSMWDSLNEDQKSAVVELYKSFEDNMKHWGLKNISSAAQ